MAATDSLNPGAFPSDLHTNAPWDSTVPTVPYPAPIPIDTDNLMAELSCTYMYESAMTTPVTSSDNLTTLQEACPQLPSRKRSAPTPPTAPTTPLNLAKRAKAEFVFATEPVTPHNAHTSSPTSSYSASELASPPGMRARMPLSPNHSVCTDDAVEEEEDARSLPATPAPTDVYSLTRPSREQAARRRACRRAALNKSRAKKEECVGECARSDAAGKGVGLPARSEGVNEAAGEPVDKKAARAIRNREAAMKSRIEAKLRMRKLQDENNCLAVKVRCLSEENEELTGQLKHLLQHTLGISMSEGQDVKQVFDMMSRMNSSRACS